MAIPSDYLTWAADTFGPVALDQNERTLRFLEEAIELAHSLDIPIGQLSAIAERVYARPAGKVDREIGQVQLTLDMLAEVYGCNARAEGRREFDRVRSIPKAEWEARHAAKVKLGIAVGALGGASS
jgi:hypothetical protein